MSSLRRLSVCLPVALMLAGPLAMRGDAAEGRFDHLLAFPPFGAAAASGARSADGANDLEFRGYAYLGGKPLFSLSLRQPDGRVRRGWVGLNENRDGYVVLSFDSTAETLLVSGAGRSVLLRLQSASVRSASEVIEPDMLAAMTAQELGRRKAQRLAGANLPPESSPPPPPVSTAP